MPYMPNLDAMLTPGYRIEHDDIVYEVQPYDVGPVILPTGKVVGCDPLGPDSTPFVDAVAPGRYRLRAWVALLHRAGREWQRRINALQLIVRDEPAASWRMALCPDEDVASLGEDQIFGYGVDAGVGTLADQVAIEALRNWDEEMIDEQIFSVMTDESANVVEAVVDEQTGANVYLVDSGWGDGAYATYIGENAAGEIISFVTDFCVLPHD